VSFRFERETVDDVPTTVLVVDDDPLARHAASRVLQGAGFDVLQAGTASAAASLLSVRQVAVVILDIGLPDSSGLDLLDQLNVSHPDLSVIMLTASTDRADMDAAILRGAVGYLRKPIDPMMLEAQVLTAQRSAEARRATRARCSSLETSLENARQSLDHLPRELARQLTCVWDLRLIETGGHVRRVGAYSEALALALGSAPVDAATLGQVAMLHDVGKMMIPDAILSKPGRLDPDELEIMKGHAAAGAKLLAGVSHPFLQRAAVVALRHHERWDGSGYPSNLRGDECPADARIVGIADVFDALHQARCYKRAWSDPEVMAYFQEQSGKLFDRRIVAALLDNGARMSVISASNEDTSNESAYSSGPTRRPAASRGTTGFA
jgi:response regulator RpfG family c-di-GMP phosphodiesterase